MRRTLVLRMLVCAALVCSMVVVAPTPVSAGGDSWHWLNPKPRGERLFAIDMVDESWGYVVGANGCVMKTYTGGKAWEQRTSPEGSTDILSAKFVSPSTGWVGTGSGKIFKTTDYAGSWTDLGAPTGGYQINDLFFTDENHGWAAISGGVLRIVNGVAQTPYTAVFGGDNILALWFTDISTGYAVANTSGAGRIYKTIDGGATWVLNHEIAGLQMADIAFTSGGKGFALTNTDTVYWTADAGATWTPQALGGAAPSAVTFAPDGQTGWMVAFGNTPRVRKTTNAGASWTEQGTNLSMGVTAVDCTSSTRCVGAGPWGEIPYTQDGTNWSPRSVITRDHFLAIQFLDLRTGYAAAAKDTDAPLGGNVWKTTDAGTTWTPLISDLTAGLFDLHFINTSIGWAVGQNGKIVKTESAGVTWNTQYAGISSNLNSVYFADANTGWVAGDGGVILKTTNGGSSWTPQSSGVTQNLQAIDFCGDFGCAVGNAGTVLFTTDGGTTWRTYATGMSDNVLSVDVVNTTTAVAGTWYRGAAASFYPAIIKTTNQGGTWTVLDVPYAYGSVEDIQFKDANNGWIVGNGGLYGATSNGGASWTTKKLQDRSFNSISVVDGWAAWAAGWYGTLMTNYWWSPTVIYRFYNLKNGTHFYTKDVNEKHYIIDNLSDTYKFEGVGFEYDEYKAEAPLYRFYKPSANTHFFTADAVERDRVINTLGHIYQYEGPVYNVSYRGGQTVWRFYKPSTGTHFYTGDPAERDRVISTLGYLYTYEGPAYYLPQ